MVMTAVAYNLFDFNLFLINAFARKRGRAPGACPEFDASYEKLTLWRELHLPGNFSNYTRGSAVENLFLEERVNTNSAYRIR